MPETATDATPGGETTRAPSRRAAIWRWTKRALQGFAIALVLLTTYAIIDGWRAFGAGAQGARAARMERSPQWRDGTFVNPQVLYNDLWKMVTGLFAVSVHANPDTEIPVVPFAPERFATPPASGLRVTWLGHSTLLLEQDGLRILTDPVWGDRSSPLTWLGPLRWYPPPIPLDRLPAVDVVLISHDHYDHLDHPTIVAMKDWDTVFVAPLGVGAHLEYWGVPAARIVELDWWDRHRVGSVEIVCTPARHASGRTLFDKDETLWASYAVLGPDHRVWFSGDTGLFPGMDEIGQRLGPFDLTMIEAGAYGSAWPDWHLGPEQAVRAHQMVRGDVMLPIHWGLFNLAYHGWTEPIERVRVAAEDAGVTLLAPRPGEGIEPSSPPAVVAWWPSLPHRSAAEDPIVATLMDAP